MDQAALAMQKALQRQELCARIAHVIFLTEAELAPPSLAAASGWHRFRGASHARS